MSIRKATAIDHPAGLGALGFCLGGAVGLLLLAEEGSRPGFAPPIAALVLGGVIGALSLAPFLGGLLPTLLAALGFGVGSVFAAAGFLFAMLIFPFTIPDNRFGLAVLVLVWRTVCLAMGFGLAGTIGGACLGLSGRVVLRSAAGFAIGGVAGAVALAVAEPMLSRFLLAANWWGPSTANIVSLGVVGILLPYVVGGALLGRTLAARQAAASSRAD